MKKLFLVFAALSITGSLSAQKLMMLESEIKLSKKAKKSGSYFGGGVNHTNDEVVAIMYYNDKDDVLFDIYRFDANNEPMDILEGANILQMAENLNYEATENDAVAKDKDFDGQKVLLVRSSFTARNVVLEEGYIEDASYTYIDGNASNPFKLAEAWHISKLIFHQEDKEKIKFSIMPFATLVSEGQFDQKAIASMQQANNESYSWSGIQSAVKASLNATFMKKNGKAVVIGRVDEGVSIKDPKPWNNNRLRTVRIDGTTMTGEEVETHAMPFAFIDATSAPIDDYNKLVSVLVPLNSPNTIPEAKQYQMDKANRNRVMITVVDKYGHLKDTVEYRSAGNDGVYSIYEDGDAILLPAMIDAKGKGFWSGYVRKPTHFQITKVVDGKLVYNNAWDMDQLSEKVSVADGEKFKKLKIGVITWGEHNVLSNGDIVYFANDAKNFYAFQVSADGELKKLHIRERYDGKSTPVDSRFIVAENGRTFWITREVPEGVVDVEYSISQYTTTTTGYNYSMTSTTTTASPRNFSELKTVVLLTEVNANESTQGNLLEIGGKNYLVIGDTGYVWGKNGSLSFIGHDFKKHKKIYSIRVN